MDRSARTAEPMTTALILSMVVSAVIVALLAPTAL